MDTKDIGYYLAKADDGVRGENRLDAAPVLASIANTLALVRIAEALEAQNDFQQKCYNEKYLVYEGETK